MTSLWNSLEVAKMIISASTPIIVILVGFSVNRGLKKFEHFQWMNQKVIEKRISVFDELAPLLNDLLCYFTYIGYWKTFSPPDIIELKRRADKIAYVNAPLFPLEFLEKYNGMMNLCFKTYDTWGQDARLKTLIKDRLTVSKKEWDNEWNKKYFADEKDCPDPKEIQKAYRLFMAYFANQLGLGLETEPVSTGEVPSYLWTRIEANKSKGQ